jgi:hypothetical protein
MKALCWNSPLILQAHSKAEQAHAKAKVFNRAYKANPKEKLFLKNFKRFKRNKTHNTQARQKSTRQMRQTDDIKMVITQDRLERQPIQQLQEIGGLVLGMNICGKNRQLLVAAKRYLQVKKNNKKSI